MKHIVLAALLTALPLTAQAVGKTEQPANCAIYAEELSKTIKADSRVSGTAQAEAVESLDKFAAYLRSLVAADMDKSYAQAKAYYGWDKATVDAKMKEGEAAARAGFVGQGMEPGMVYADHLLAINSCGKNMMQQGKLGQADVDKLATRMNAVYVAIR